MRASLLPDAVSVNGSCGGVELRLDEPLRLQAPEQLRRRLRLRLRSQLLLARLALPLLLLAHLREHGALAAEAIRTTRVAARLRRGGRTAKL